MAEFGRFGFGAGLVSRDFAGRVDVDQYHRSCVTLENMELLQSGAVRRRCGSRFLAELPGDPMAMEVFLWSTSVLNLVVIYATKMEVRDTEGVLLFASKYAANEGKVRMLQINDLIVIANSRQTPYSLRNAGGVFSFAPIAWKHTPMTGNWSQPFPLNIFLSVVTVADKWESFVRIGAQKKCYKAYYGGVWFYPGQILAVRYLLGGESYPFIRDKYWVVEMRLKTDYATSGMSACVKGADGSYTHWTCPNGWIPRADAYDDPAMYPDDFIPGAPCWESPIGGGWDLECKSHGYDTIFELQEEVAGRWETVQSVNLKTLPSDNHIFTGDTGGYTAKMRLALVKTAGAVSSDIDRKVVLRRKAARVVMYMEVTTVNDDGTFYYKLLDYSGFVRMHQITDWDVQAFGDFTGYSGVVAFHAGRLVFAGTDSQPQTLWFSAADDFFNLETGKNDADAMALTLSSTAQSRVVWAASSGSALLVGTTAGEIVIRAGGNTGALSATSAIADNHSFCGSADVEPLRSTDAMMFVDRSGKRLRRLGYSMDSDLYFARDMSVFAYGVLSGGAVDACWQRAPQPVAWVVPEVGKNAGKLAGMLYNPDQQISSWFVWDLGAPVRKVSCAASGAAIDPLFLCVERKKIATGEGGEPPVDPDVTPPKVPVEVIKDYVRVDQDLRGLLANFSSSKFYFTDDALKILSPDPEAVSGVLGILTEGVAFDNRPEGSGYYRLRKGKPVQAVFSDFGKYKFDFGLFWPSRPLQVYYDLPPIMIEAGYKWRFKALGGWVGVLVLRISDNGSSYRDLMTFGADCVHEGVAAARCWVQLRVWGYSRRDGLFAGETAMERWKTEVEYVDAGTELSAEPVMLAAESNDEEPVESPMYCLETLDWQERDMDSAGNGDRESRFVATVVTSPLDQPQFYGKKGISTPIVELLMDGVDLSAVEVSSGSDWCPITAQGDGDGWVSSLSLTNGGYVRAVGIRYNSGHGMIMAGRVRNGD